MGGVFFRSTPEPLQMVSLRLKAEFPDSEASFCVWSFMESDNKALVWVHRWTLSCMAEDS